MTYQPPTQPPEVDEGGQALADLHGAVTDVMEALDEIIDSADSELAQAARAFRDLHEGHQTGLGEALVRMGVDPDDEGGFLGLGSKSLGNTGGTFSASDVDDLTSLLTAERDVVELYTDAAAEGGHPDEVDDIVTQQRDELADLIESYE